MKQMLKYLGTPMALVVAFLLFGAPSAPGVTAVEAVADVAVDVGGCAVAYAPGEDEDDYPGRDCEGRVAELDGAVATLAIASFGFAFLPAGQFASTFMAGALAYWGYARYVPSTCE